MSDKFYVVCGLATYFCYFAEVSFLASDERRRTVGELAAYATAQIGC